MRRMRCFARVLVVLGLVVAALSASAGTLMLIGPVTLFEPGTAGHILAMTFAAIMGLFAFAKAFNAMLVQPIMDKMEAQQKAMIAAGLIALKESFAELLDHHVAANDPHPKASDRMHVPLYEADQKILSAVAELRQRQEKDSKRLGRLIAAHNATMAEEHAGFCVATEHRNPKDTPYPRRESDPEDADFTEARGRTKPDPRIVENGEDE